jgi:hypothetical protein
MKKWMTTLLFLPLSAAAGPSQTGVNCQIKDLSKCSECKTRVPASCENHQFLGQLQLETKPQKIQWILSNSKTGTEQIVESANSKLRLKDLKDLEQAARQLKLKVTSGQKLALGAVTIDAKTPFYKNAQGQDIAAVLKKQTNQRNIASTAAEPVIGGIRRAQSSKEKK